MPAREHGIRQFLDHASGLPTRDNVHRVAQAVHPDCRVVYVDNDPAAETHGRTLLDENDGTEVTDRHPDTEPRVLQSGDFIEYGGLARIP